MTNNSNQNAAPKANDWVAKMFKHLTSVLDKYMQQFPRHEELIAFMKDESQMYDTNGKLTDEYMYWINEFNEFCKKHSLKYAEEDGLDSNKIEVLKGVEDFLSKQKELMKLYRNSSNKDEWPNEMLDSQEKRDAFDKLIDENSNNAINEFENIINKEA